MMKNNTNPAKNGRHLIGIPLLVLLATLIMCPKVNALKGDNQPDGRIITVSGYVTCQGERISDVLVDAVSTNEETVSDREGKFTISVVKGGVLTFQKEGYGPYEYMADEPRDNLIICLLPLEETGEADEREATGHGEEKEAVIIIQTKKENDKD